jgi:hypothetical protein
MLSPYRRTEASPLSLLPSEDLLIGTYTALLPSLHTCPPELADPGQGSPGLLVVILTRRYPLEAHLSHAVGQQGVEP